MGRVVSVQPLKISIQNGLFLLEADDVYICNQLLERKSKFTATGMIEQSGTLNASCPVSGHSGSYSANGQMILEGDEIHLQAVLQAGDMVLVIPDASDQHFFIVDIIKAVE